MSEYLEFVETGDTGKTKVFMVRSKHGGANLGEISWYATWRQYIFMPARITVWNTDCLDTIITFIRGLMRAREMAKRARAECGGFHIYEVTDDDVRPCERCGKPYNEMDVT